jgi:hypothetical protein
MQAVIDGVRTPKAALAELMLRRREQPTPRDVRRIGTILAELRLASGYRQMRVSWRHDRTATGVPVPHPRGGLADRVRLRRPTRCAPPALDASPRAAPDRADRPDRVPAADIWQRDRSPEIPTRWVPRLAGAERLFFREIRAALERGAASRSQSLGRLREAG